MNLTDELQKLADLRTQGHLTDAEFIAAKQKLLAQDSSRASSPPAPPESERAEPAEPLAAITEERTFWSSRWSSGNLFFRDSLTLASDGLVFRKGAFFSSTREHINYRSIASLKCNDGIFLATISIETSGGSQPIVINGLWKSDAREIQQLVSACQR